jgi:hypothetical protein
VAGPESFRNEAQFAPRAAVRRRANTTVVISNRQQVLEPAQIMDIQNWAYAAQATTADDQGDGADNDIGER